MADVLVTGATGLLGSRVVPRLAEAHRVVALARRLPDDLGDTEWLAHDLSGPSLPARMPDGIDVVVHLAQGRGFREFPGRAMDTYSVNVGSTALLLDWACRAGARQFVLASTGGVYRPGPRPHRENEPVDAGAISSFYAASKLAAEALARAYGAHLVVTVLRPFFIYGRGQEAGMLFPRLVESLRAGRPITIDGENGMRFNPVHVSDAARAVAAALMTESSCVLNVAGPQVLSLREAVEVLAGTLGAEPAFDPRPEASPTDFIADISEMTQQLGPPATTLAEAARELCC